MKEPSMTFHEQAQTSRAAVDTELAELLECLWAAGIETQFSCQGGDYRGNGDPQPAYIMFASVDDAMRFLTETMERSYWYNRLSLQLAEPLHDRATGENSGPARARVEWPVIDRSTEMSVTAALTDVWAGRQTQDHFARRAELNAASPQSNSKR